MIALWHRLWRQTRARVIYSSRSPQSIGGMTAALAKILTMEKLPFLEASQTGTGDGVEQAVFRIFNTW